MRFERKQPAGQDERLQRRRRIKGARFNGSDRCRQRIAILFPPAGIAQQSRLRFVKQRAGAVAGIIRVVRRNTDLPQAAAVPQRVVFDQRHARRNVQRFQRDAVFKRACADALHALVQNGAEDLVRVIEPRRIFHFARAEHAQFAVLGQLPLQIAASPLILDRSGSKNKRYRQNNHQYRKQNRNEAFALISHACIRPFA